MTEYGTVTQFFHKVQDGDRSAVRGLWQHFFPRLIRLAEKTLSPGTVGGADAEDAVQSAFVSFWQRAEEGGFAGELNRNNLWKLLATITVRKAQKQRIRERSQKRGGGRVFPEAALHEDFRLDQALAQLPTQEFDVYSEELLERLPDDLRRFALLRLMGHQDKEIAALLDCTKRKVERKLKLIRETWAREIGD